MKIWKLKELHVTQSTIAYLFFRFGVSLITVARHKFGSRCRFTESIFRKLDQQKIIPAHVTVILYCSLIQSRPYTSSICWPINVVPSSSINSSISPVSKMMQRFMKFILTSKNDIQKWKGPFEPMVLEIFLWIICMWNVIFTVYICTLVMSEFYFHKNKPSTKMTCWLSCWFSMKNIYMKKPQTIAINMAIYAWFHSLFQNWETLL